MVKANEKTLSEELEDMPVRLLRRAVMHASPNTVIGGRVDGGAGKAQGPEKLGRGCQERPTAASFQIPATEEIETPAPPPQPSALGPTLTF